MHRFYVPPENITRDHVIIREKKEIHHMQDVLRLGRGAEVVIFDGNGNEYNARIKSLSDHQIELAIIGLNQSKNPRKWHVCLCCALPKKSKFSFIIEKATELGVDRIIPLKTARTIVTLKTDQEGKKLERWREIAINACKQSQGSEVPRIEKVLSFKQALQETRAYELILIPCLKGRRKKIEEVLMQFPGKSIFVFIGPEGDFTSQELVLASKEKCIPVTLGDRVLKVDSAAFYVLSVINSISHLRF